MSLIKRFLAENNPDPRKTPLKGGEVFPAKEYEIPGFPAGDGDHFL
jgi:hypothetical protein